jgi:hypothetical protein
LVSEYSKPNFSAKQKSVKLALFVPKPFAVPQKKTGKNVLVIVKIYLTVRVLISFANQHTIMYFEFRTGTKLSIYLKLRVRVMVFNTTFNNIPVISWRSVLLTEETGVPRENQISAASD